jgi:glutathione S-transferase
MLKIWGRANSINVQKVLWCCEELGVEHDRVDAGGPYGLVDTPEYRRRNPNGLVPTIDDDGFVIWESNAIVRYLVTKHRSGLWPADPRLRAEADQWMDWGHTFWAALRPAFLGLIRTPPEQRNEAAIAESLRKTEELLRLMDDHLRSRPYLAGDEFTVGDIPVGCGIWRWLAMPIERPARPNVVRWSERLAQRPAYRRIVMSPLT